MNKMIIQTLTTEYFPTSQFNNNTKNIKFIELKNSLKKIKEYMSHILPIEQYEIKAHTGEGKIAACPWIGIRSQNNNFDSKPKSGLYLTILWKYDGTGVCLSFQKGTDATPKHILHETVTRVRNKYGDTPFSTSIDLKVPKGKPRPKSYEDANIYGKSYDNDNIEELLNDLILMEQYYSNVIQGKTKNLEVIRKMEEEESSYQAPLAQKNHNTYRKTWIRNKKTRDEALKNAKYQCEIDSSHKTFMLDDKYYMEGHHLIPMEYQSMFSKQSLDIEENIISLCPTCHRKIHYASVNDKITMVQSIFAIKGTKLIQKVNIDLELLESLYDNI